MRTKRFEGTETRMILVAMITDQTSLARIFNQWVEPGLFEAKWANLVGGWCIEHFRKYQKPPNNRIGRIFELWATRPNTDEKTAEAVEHFLQSLSDDHTEIIPDQIIDIAGTYFTKVRIAAEIEAAKVEIENGQIEQAVSRVQSVNRVNLSVKRGVNVATDIDAWIRADQQEETNPLVRYPLDLGDFTNGAFTRSSLYAILAPDKTGKSTWLLDFAYRAVRQRNRVIYFDTGDSSEDEVLAKFRLRSSMRPKFEGLLKVPTGWSGNEPTISEIRYDPTEVVQAFRDFGKICKSDDVFKIECYPNSSVTVQDLDAILNDYSRIGWEPDVVVIDYADILAKPKGLHDPIESINETWKAMRRMSQQRNCLVMTATQTKATGYKKIDGLLGPDDFSGSKGKNAHVNGIMAINVSAKEKDMGAARINWPVRRRGASNPSWFCRVAGCIALGNPAIVSNWNQ